MNRGAGGVLSREGKPMSLFGGLRASSPAPGRARSQTATLIADQAAARPPHFQTVPADLPTVDEARRLSDQLRLLLSDLDRREQSLNSQLTLIEREQRTLRSDARQFAEAQQALEFALAEREASLS